jgi:hypothetical protein
VYIYIYIYRERERESYRAFYFKCVAKIRGRGVCCDYRKPPVATAENYEAHQTTQTFHENVLQCPLGLTLVYVEIIYTAVVCIPLKYAALCEVHNGEIWNSITSAGRKTKLQLLENSV